MGAQYGLTYNSGLSDLAGKLRNLGYVYNPFENIATPPAPDPSTESWLQQYGTAIQSGYAQGQNPLWLFFAHGSNGSTAAGIANNLATNNATTTELAAIYDWYQGGANGSNYQAGDQAALLNYENRTGTSLESFLASPGVAIGTPAVGGGAVAPGSKPVNASGFANSVDSVLSSAGKIASTASSLLGSLTGGSAAPPPPKQTVIVPGPSPGLIIGFIALAGGIAMFIIAATEPMKRIPGEHKRAI